MLRTELVAITEYLCLEIQDVVVQLEMMGLPGGASFLLHYNE